jgi:hypothetical protein
MVPASEDVRRVKPPSPCHRTSSDTGGCGGHLAAEAGGRGLRRFPGRRSGSRLWPECPGGQRWAGGSKGRNFGRPGNGSTNRHVSPAHRPPFRASSSRLQGDHRGADTRAAGSATIGWSPITSQDQPEEAIHRVRCLSSEEFQPTRLWSGGGGPDQVTRSMGTSPCRSSWASTRCRRAA